MKLGLYRQTHADRGELAKVHWAAGDAAPWLDRETYTLMGFHPDFDSLPERAAYLRQHPRRGEVEA